MDRIAQELRAAAGGSTRSQSEGLSPAGSKYVFPEAWRHRAQSPAGWVNANFHSVALKIVRKAGLELWPRPWPNLRASCESDPASTFPLAVVTKWLGDTSSVALRDYVDPTDEAFERAMSQTRGAAKSAAQCALPALQETLHTVQAYSGRSRTTATQPLKERHDTPLVACSNSL